MESSTQAEPANPTQRMFRVLETIVAKDHLVSLQTLADETGIPKPTLHRMLGIFVAEGLLVRQSDRRFYGSGPRLRIFAENVLVNATQFGARHGVLRQLVDTLGETCNITTLIGNEVLYLDRVETPVPLRFHFGPGSRVPAHCSASGKLLLSQMSPSTRQHLIQHAELERYTENTVTTVEELEAELHEIARQGYAIDNEEYIYGLVCFAVLIPGVSGRSGQCVAVQAPSIRLTPADAERVVPHLQQAARQMRVVDSEGVPVRGDGVLA